MQTRSYTRPGIFLSFDGPAQPLPFEQLSPRYVEVYEEALTEVRAKARKAGDHLEFRDVASPKLGRITRMGDEVCFDIPCPVDPTSLYVCLHEFYHYLHGDVDVPEDTTFTSEERRQKEMRAVQSAVIMMKHFGVYEDAVEDFALTCLISYGVDLDRAEHILEVA